MTSQGLIPSKSLSQDLTRWPLLLLLSGKSCPSICPIFLTKVASWWPCLTAPNCCKTRPIRSTARPLFHTFLLEPGPVRLEVFALSGQRIAVLHQGPQQAGYHRLHWDGRDAAGHSVASGTYLYRLVTDEVVLTRKLVLLR